jgi:hypothetical protein
MQDISELIGKIVDVGTVETVYTGILIEVNENEIYLQSDSGWMTIPVERVAYVRKGGS